MKDDNYMNPNDKKRWGFSGKAGEIKVGEKTVGETGGVDHVRTEPENGGARQNGGGDRDMTKADLQAELDSRGIEYPSNANKAELQALLNGGGEQNDQGQQQ